MKKVIGLTYNLKTDWKVGEGDPKDASAEFDKPETIDRVVRVLEKAGFVVKRIGDVDALLKQLDKLDVDLVFNLCEGKKGRNREAEVPVLLEMKGVPFVGSDGLTMGITLDKVVAKQVFIAEGIPTPKYFVVNDGDDAQKLNKIGFPLIVKTSREGSSKGISKDSKVTDLESLKKRAQFINETYDQPALVEEFIRGMECTVAVIGNNPPQVMPIVQTTIDGKFQLGEEFYTNARIYSDAIKYVCPARFSDRLIKRIEDIAARAYKAVGCRDFARIDFRIDEKENPYVLEINPLPSLDYEDAFNIFPQVIGSSYDEMIVKIINFALERYGLLGYDKSHKEKLLGSAVNL
ncbi:MAG TPA: ATP-grasp domain-containing protein [Candidatus Omnitrophota bacterium]|nr:ATP-grasp domain-containing protein [Candidatus Omnitrophota bacterium]